MTEILDPQQLADRLQIHVDQVRKLTAEGRIPHLPIGPRMTRYNFAEVCDALRVVQHTDDDAVDQFAAALRKRLAEKREEGRNGWETTSVDDLCLKLLRSIADGDPIDVGNYAMMINALGGGTEHALNPQSLDALLYEIRSDYRLIPCKAVEQWNLIAEAARALLRAWSDEDGAIKPAMERLAKELG